MLERADGTSWSNCLLVGEHASDLYYHARRLLSAFEYNRLKHLEHSPVTKLCWTIHIDDNHCSAQIPSEFSLCGCFLHETMLLGGQTTLIKIETKGRRDSEKGMNYKVIVEKLEHIFEDS